MGSVERIFFGITAVALATTLVLPGRQTPQVTEKLFGGISNLYGTVISGRA